MTAPAHGIFSVDELNAIRDAHIEWCASRSIEPASPLGQDAVMMIMRAFQGGTIGHDELLAECEAFISEREQHVRIGSPAIASLEVANPSS